MKRILSLLSVVLVIITLFGACNKKKDQDKINAPKKKEQKSDNILVTLVELGSVKCIPCKKMMPIIEEIKKDFKGQIKVVFHDIKTEEGRPYSSKYNIRLIPTQVFLDKNGEEYFRHEGFFPKEDLIKVLQQKGVK